MSRLNPAEFLRLPRLELRKLELRHLIALCCATLVALALTVTVGAYLLLRDFQQVENFTIHAKAEQVHRAFSADLAQLEAGNRKAAESNEARELVRTRNRAAAANTFTAERVLGLDADLVWIVDADGTELFSALVDASTRAAQSPAPPEALAPFRRLQEIRGAVGALAAAERTVPTSQGLAAFAQTAIAGPDPAQPAAAYLLSARYIDAGDIERLASASGLPVTLIYTAASTDALPENVAEWAKARMHGSPTFVHAASEQSIVGYAGVRGVNGDTLAVLATESPRQIRAAGKRATTYLLSTVAGLFLVFALSALTLAVRVLVTRGQSDAQSRKAEEAARTPRAMARQAEQDVLTQLPNRIYLESRLPKLLAKMVNSERLVAIVHLDIDHFKNINDSRGHEVGDQLLKIIAKRLRAAISDHDLVVRMGGDEFVVVAPLMTDMDAIEQFAERLQAAVAGDIVIEEKTFNVTASMGIVVFPQDGNDMSVLLKHADIALFQAKEAGRRCHRFFAADMTARIRVHTTTEQSLRKAIGTKQIYMEYQPIVDLRDRRVLSLEALMRWEHPTKGPISPGQFIPVAEHSGLIVELGEQALRIILGQQRQWLDEGVPIVPVAVNVSALQVERVDFPAMVAELCALASLEARWVRFEITETAMTKEPEKLIGTLQALRNMGSQVLIDDFGTGYSSLSYLDRLPADIVKIDRAFIQDISPGEEPPIVHSIISMARRLRLKTVAEGIESAAQADLLLRWGCHYGQGYYFSRPVKAEQCRALLEELRREKAITQTAVVRALKSDNAA